MTAITPYLAFFPSEGYSLNKYYQSLPPILGFHHHHRQTLPKSLNHTSFS